MLCIPKGSLLAFHQTSANGSVVGVLRNDALCKEERSLLLGVPRDGLCERQEGDLGARCDFNILRF